MFCIYQIDADIVKKVIAESFSIREVAIKLNISQNGSMYPAFKEYVREHDLCIDHFLGKRANSGIRYHGKTYTRFEDIKSNSSRKRWLIKERGHNCQICKNMTWLSDPIPLELHHIDGNSDNATIENLLLICPNCHAKTDTYKGKNMGKFSCSRRNQYYKNTRVSIPIR
jgi:hypothetical protein